MATGTPVPFFDDAITLIPDTVSTENIAMLGRKTTIREFAQGEPCSLTEWDDGTLSVRTRSGRFMAGPESHTA